MKTFYTLFWCLHCWFWTSKCWLGIRCIYHFYKYLTIIFNFVISAVLFQWILKNVRIYFWCIIIIFFFTTYSGVIYNTIFVDDPFLGQLFSQVKFFDYLGLFQTPFGVFLGFNPANIYLFKVNDRNTRKRWEICSKLTIKTPERRHDVVLVFLLSTLNIFHTFSNVYIVDFQ